jgi:toxin CcdB
MSQFDVHRNNGPQRESIPFLVVVQSAVFDNVRRRIVIPLIRRTAPVAANLRPARVTPNFKFEGVDVILNPFEIASVSIAKLGAKVGDLKDHGSTITDALDEVFSRTWG